MKNREAIICDYCGNVISKEYVREHPKLINNQIRLCENCSKDRRKYSSAWHKKNKDTHNETNRKYQEKYRKEGKHKEAIAKFWAHHKERRREYMKKYYKNKAAKLGISIKEVYRIARECMLGGTTPENVKQRLDYISEKHKGR